MQVFSSIARVVLLMLIVVLSPATLAQHGQPSGPASLEARICRAVDCVEELAIQLSSAANEMSAATASGARERLLRQARRARHAHGILVALKNRPPMPDPSGGGGGAVGGIQIQSPLKFDYNWWLATPWEFCKDLSSPQGARRYYSFRGARSFESICINRMILDSANEDIWGHWGDEMLAVALIHEVQRLQRQVCFIWLPRGLSLPPHPPLPAPLGIFFDATTQRAHDCMELELHQRDLELIEQLIVINDTAEPANRWTAAVLRNVEYLKERIEFKIEELKGRKDS